MTDKTPPEEAQLLQGAAAFIAKAVEMAGGASRELRLLSDTLDGRLWGGADIADAVRRFLLRSEYSRLRVLVNNVQSAMHNSPRLVELARHLTSRVELRQPPEERRQNYRGELLIADRSQLLERREPGTMDARFLPHEPAVTQVQISNFDELWDQSEPSEEMRSLGL
ncbi:MAG: hypothetical protein ISP90_18190 [Nevskia sp.]|nr:hypothetical protein [Nevskia sp.]